MKELGKPEDYTDEDRDISLVLENRFPQAVEERVTEGNQLFVQTKTMLISVLRQLPQTLKIVSSGAQGDPMLTDILKAGHKWAEEENNESIKEKIRIVLANIAELEKAGVVSSDDGHRTLLRAITLEIANRAQIREQQNKELARLHLALNTAVKQQKFLTEQYSQYMQYIQVVKSRPYTTTKKKRPPRAAKPSASQPEQKLLGPFKFSYSELVRKHVIAESTIPDLVRRAMKLFVTSSEPGIFDIEVKIPAVESAKLRIDIDDLLEQQSRHQEHMTHQIEQASLTLDVNMTIHFLNSLLTKK
jgi:Ras GTPase-activating-like protein IQGAP2/3